jgi:crotonobetainyl-CoA:carnitine CoA-transferase CaiB-like acyl-CoA transferase
MTSALEGIVVVDLTHHIVGPYCTKLLADYGAEVIKIERPEVGDPARQMGPFYHDEPHLDGSGLFLALNTNKKSVTLNLKGSSGQSVLKELVRQADIVVESFAPRVLPKLGLDYAHLSQVNPRLVMTSISNFGQTGPYRDYKMSEITMYAIGGTMHSTGMPDREPVKLGLTAQQFYAGMVSATATLGAFMGYQLHNVGQHVDLSLFEIMTGSQDRAVQGHTTYQFTGVLPQRTGGRAGRNILPNGVYPTADGYVQLFAMRPVWKEACLMIDRPDLIDDPYFSAPENFAGNPEAKAAFDAILLEWLLSRTKKEVTEKAQSVGYICGVLNSVDEVFDDPHLEARDYFTEIDHPHTGPLKYPGAPFRMSDTPPQPGRAPLLGEHTEVVLKERLGYSSADIARLRVEGIIQ